MPRAEPRRRSAVPVTISPSAATSAIHRGNPVNGSVEPETRATVPSTPCFAGFAFGVESAVCVPATLPAFVVGATVVPGAVAGATTAAGVTTAGGVMTWPGGVEPLVQTSPVGVTTVELEVELTCCFATPLPRCLPFPCRAACEVVVIVVTLVEPQTELVITCRLWVGVQLA